MLTLNIAILLPFIAATVILVFRNSALIQRIHLGWFVLFIPAAIFIGLARYIPAISKGQTFTNVTKWIPSFDINFITHLDGLSMIFGLLISGIGVLVIIYSIYYLATEKFLVHFYIYLLLFMGSMLGIVFSDHLIVLYVFWELTSISSFLLIAFWYQRKGSRYGAKKALLITILGGLAMFVGFLMIYFVTGTFSISEIIASVDTLKAHPLLTPIILLILLGAFTKSAQFPFHIWLPDAMEAPTPISAYLHSATMVKAGIFLVARFTPVFGGVGLWFWLVTGIGLLTLFWGAFIAIRQTDLKALLAYSTISQLGLIMSLFGISSLSFHPDFTMQNVLYTQAAFAALFHLVNHSTFKGALFMVIGIIDFQAGTRDLRRLGGLMSIMPISFTLAMIGSFSMAGLPPFNGFLSKEMFFTAMLNLKNFDLLNIQSVATLFPVIAWIASIFTFLYSMMIVFLTFLGPKRKTPMEDVKEASVGMLIGPTVLASLVLLIFFFPNVLAKYLLKPAISSIYPGVSDEWIAPVSLWHGFNMEVKMTIGVILLGSLLYVFRHHIRKVYVLFPSSLSFDNLYNTLLETIDNSAKAITNFYMTGYLRNYLVYIFLFFAIGIGGMLFFLDAFTFSTAGDQPIGKLHMILTATIVIAGITILFAKARLTAILVNGYIGFSVAMLFVLFRAPDLALTQLVVETVSTALFLLCFYFLPNWDLSKQKGNVRIRNAVIALAVGVTFTLVALSVKSGRLFDSISAYFENAYELAGGKNIVNTILGDFRAFDTMLEVVVLFIAGIGVFTLIKYNQKKGADNLED